MDQFHVKFETDGTITVSTGKVSDANHRQAEDFLKWLATMTDGNTRRTPRPHHAHGIEEHAHDATSTHEH
mgnify:FL=1